MRRVLIASAILAAAVIFVVLATGASQGTAGQSYKVELDNAFGLVQGADFKVAGVRAGKISNIDLCSHQGEPQPGKPYTGPCKNAVDALVTIDINQSGFGSFKSDAFCQSRPQSLIGEYFVDCQPGTNGTPLKNNSVIQVDHTGSTVPADLLNNVMRMPYRQRFALIINELGAAVAGRSADLQDALRRAVPALTQTDNLLNLLANDSKTLQALTTDSDTVVTALANNNSAGVTRFIDEANRAATATAAQQGNLAATWQKLPPFLDQLKPTLQTLGTATDANLPVLQNLHAASGQLNRLFADLPGFANSSRISLTCGEQGQAACPNNGSSLGTASKTGKVAVQAAAPTVAHLNKFAKPARQGGPGLGELAQNLAIVGKSLEDRGRAVEADPRSPGGKGYTGLEALLQYVFNQTMAINTFSTNPATGQPLYHQLTVDAFIDPACAPYATPRTIAQNLKGFGPAYRRCYAWLGPNQQGVNERDPSAPNNCVPDPGGLPPGHSRPPSVGSPCKLNGAADTSGANSSQANRGFSAAASPASANGTATGTSPPSGTAGSPSSTTTGTGSGPAINLHSTIGQVIGALRGGGSPSTGQANNAPSSGQAGGPQSGGQAKQLLNYLLAP